LNHNEVYDQGRKLRTLGSEHRFAQFGDGKGGPMRENQEEEN